MFFAAILASILLLAAGPADAQVRVQIGINVPVFPSLVRVPGYPVYYNPRANSNYFFYDGLYWVYWQDNWYESSWYNGPWRPVGPEDVPLFVLRVPVRYYHQPPAYFRGWRADAPPRWGEHWGHDWERRRGGWDRWDRRAVPPPAPLPRYQQRYSGGHYPHAEEQQHSIRTEHYRYQPREAVAQQHLGRPQDRPRENRAVPQERGREGGLVRTERGREERAVPQDRGRENKAVPPGRGPENRTVPQDRGRDNRLAQPDRGHENRAATPDKGRENRAVPPGRGPENRAATPDKGRENRAVPPGRGPENRAATPDKGRENKPAPQGGGQEKKAPPPDRHREDRN